MKCGHCGADQPADNKFCEECGAALVEGSAIAPPSPGARCPHCDAKPGTIDAQGFCEICGCERASAGRDHMEIRISATLAGVSDRGRHKHRNEDFIALAGGDGIDVIVLCDGVSSSQNPDQAAEAAAVALCDALMTSLRDTAFSGRAAMESAIAAASAAVHAIPFSPKIRLDPPEATVVAASRKGHEVTIGWIGDSRAYLVWARGSRQLTEDHSWMNEVIAAGEMEPERARKHPQARSITRTLGGPHDGDGACDEASFVTIDLSAEPEEPIWLLLCTDGFWDALDEEERLCELLKGKRAVVEEAIVLSRWLVEHARVKCGQDNISVGVLRLR